VAEIVRVLITGMNGTLAPRLADHISQLDHEIIAWDRQQFATEDSDQIQRFFDKHGVDAVFHLAMGSEFWAEQLAMQCNQRDLPFLFTSTAMVFDQEPNGPHYPNDQRTARDDYGRYKIRCENAVLSANARAVIARIGYQIDTANPTGNNMFAHLQAKAAQGEIRASSSWIPACSFMQDTAAALWQLAEHSVASNASGIFHLDSNAACTMNYHQIVQALAALTHNHWSVIETQDYQHDQRLLDDSTQLNPVQIQSLRSHFS
jgi:dTDP-4-dehydrorhamnose reductase